MAFKVLDRRLRTRFRIELPFTLKNGGQSISGRSRNVSILGISAYTSASLPQAQSVQCLLEIPGESKPIVVNGTIIRCHLLDSPTPEGSYEVGVFFKEFQDSGEAILSEYLRQIESKEEAALKAGYKALKRKVVERQRRKRAERFQKQRRRLARLRKRRQKLAKQKRLLAQRNRKRRASRRVSAQQKKRSS